MKNVRDDPDFLAAMRHLGLTPRHQRRPLPLKTLRLVGYLVSLVMLGRLMYEHRVGPGYLIVLAFIGGVIAERIG